MEVSEIKEEVIYFLKDLKVKEENSSSVVYDVKATSKSDIITKEEDQPQSSQSLQCTSYPRPISKVGHPITHAQQEFSRDAKMKGENFSTVAYETGVTSKVHLSEMKPKEEDPPQSPPISITKDIQSSVGTNVKPDQDSKSNVVYEVEVTSKVDVKPNEEHPPQGHPDSVTNEEIQSDNDITVNSDKDPQSDESEIETQPKNNREGKFKNKSEGDSRREHRQQISQNSQTSSRIKRNQKVAKRRKRLLKIQKSQLLQCTRCPKSFSRVERLITHARNKHATTKCTSSDTISDKEDETASQCPLCLKCLASFPGLRNHFLYFHIKNKPFQCSVCLESTNEIKKFPTQNLLKAHIRRVHDPARFKFKCKVCSRKFTNRAIYEKHKKIHIEKKYKCEYCSNDYRTQEAMLMHIIAVHKEYTDRHNTFKCDECEQLFSSKNKLDWHFLQTHEENTVQCKICFKKFREEGKLSKHLEMSHWENRTWLVCDVCSKVFHNNKDLVEHLEVKHKRFFKCRKCFRSFNSKEDYDCHSTETLDEEGRKVKRPQLQCRICLIFLKTECAFITHKDTHLKTGEIGIKNVFQLQSGVGKERECDFCSKTFRKKSLLIQHAMECHPNEKWDCKSCDKSFRLKYQLNEHEIYHSKSKPFACKVCKKSFTQIGNLRVHEGTHKKNKRFKCSHCKKSFAFNLCLRLHMANYHGTEKPFKCHICEKAFIVQSGLAQHLRFNPVEGRFGCKNCSHRYKCVQTLRNHQQRCHSENKNARQNRSSRKDRSYPARLGPHLKYFEDLVYVCALQDCNFETKDEKEVAIHNAMHGLPLLVLSRELPPRSSIKSLDSPSSSSALTFRQKIKKRTVGPRFKCKYCFKMYITSHELSKHMKRVHPASLFAHTKTATVHKSQEKKMFECTECKKTFTTSSGLRYHFRTHHGGEKRFKCDICKVAFVFKCSLVQHSRSHTDARPFSCSECSYASKDAEHLRRHQQRRHAENPSIKYGKPWLQSVRPGSRSKFFEDLVFVCGVEECNFETKDDKEVALHYVKHRLPKVILPRLIDGPSSQVFLSKSTLANKNLIQARYKCKNCAVTFSKSYGLQRHMRELHMSVNG